jgi:hypothetical protein
MVRSRRTTPQMEPSVVASTAPVNTRGTRARSTRSQSHDNAATQPVPAKAMRQRRVRQASVESASSVEGRISRARRTAKQNAAIGGA